MKKILVLLFVPFSSVFAQTGQIVGRVLDESGQGLPSVGIQVVGTTTGVMSGVDGRYRLRVTAGTTTIQVRRIGYTPKTITGIIVPNNGIIEQDIIMSVAKVQLSAINVTAVKENGSISGSLNAQKNATNVTNAITSEQISRSPDSDAAQAAQRISGVAVQDGKYLQVRGLNERYTTASLNGVRLPSPEPERKVVPLDLFPSSLLQEINTSKTFTPDQPGDFAGATVNIKTKEFPARKQLNYSMSVGANNRVLSNTLPFAPRAGGELFALSGSARNMPTDLANANFLGNVTQSQMNSIIRSQRNVWAPQYRDGRGNSSFGVSAGGNTILGKNIGYVLSSNYGYSEEVRSNEQLAVGNQGANNTVVPLTSLRGQTARVGVQWGGIVNLSTMIGQSSRVSLNSTFTRNADNEARVDGGFDENLADSISRTTLRYVERGVVAVTGQGDHQLSTNNKTSWSLTTSNTTRKEPDRSDVVYARNGTNGYSLLTSLDGARRLYFNLQEHNVVGQLDHTLTVGNQNNIKVGTYYRTTERNTQAPIYAFISRANENVTTQPANVIFSKEQACETCNIINIQPIGQAGSYTANDVNMAGYVMTEWQLLDYMRMIVGGRVEGANIQVNTSTQGGFTVGSALQNVDVLPAFLLNTKMSDNTNLRFAISRTVTRPEYRELAPVTFRDVLGGVSVTGNSKLRRGLINNIDIRYEHFPTPNEIFSIGLFAKQFIDPIERVEQATSGAYQANFQNALTADNIGIEVELRKQLLTSLSVFSNITVMSSTVQLDVSRGLTVTDSERALVGQAPYVINAGVTYSSLSGRTNATLLYNTVGDRIFAAGVIPLPNIVEKSRHMLDLTLKAPIGNRANIKLDIRNILDARFRFMQGNLEREGYNVGRAISVGMSVVK